MPFDGTAPASLAELSRVLRHPEEWPEGFRWNYASCAMCALGLAFALNHIRDADACDAAEAYEMPYTVAVDIFYRLTNSYWQDITPIHVADAIDAYLATVAHKVAA